MSGSIQKAKPRQRFFAWIMKRGDRLNHQVYDRYKRSLFHDLGQTVVEIGPGTGVNFPYFTPGIHWIGVEPNPAFYDILQTRARAFDPGAEILSGDASHIPLPDNVADSVVCTLVLCSVKNVPQSLQEMRRVLKPGGRLFFIEHVAASKNSWLLFFQNIFNPLNQWVADGCHSNRPTGALLEEAGFSSLQFSRESVPGIFPLHKPHIVGIAVR